RKSTQRLSKNLIDRQKFRIVQGTKLAQQSQKVFSTNLNTSLLNDDSDDLVEGYFTGGWATYFTQNNTPGACGIVHKDSDVIVALDYRRYGDLDSVSKHCGKTVEIKTTNGTVQAQVADACPTCLNQNCLDLSEGAFSLLGATKEEGMVPIEWKFV
ncbi:hypothetical protein O181_078418, partial [Austropuccinia psidii MF-1]|nr:hypothetical protein [Austropuccinia psidii MF-1]